MKFILKIKPIPPRVGRPKRSQNILACDMFKTITALVKRRMDGIFILTGRMAASHKKISTEMYIQVQTLSFIQTYL